MVKEAVSLRQTLKLGLHREMLGAGGRLGVTSIVKHLLAPFQKETFRILERNCRESGG